MAIATSTTAATLTEQAAVASYVRDAYDAHRPIYPVGGRTSLDCGSPIPADAELLNLSGLSKVVDYTPRDMTIIVESGIRMAALADLLTTENQQLPIDVPRVADATLGGVVATNWSGPRRLGYGTMRDYVIGINAVDGRGVAFKGGGRVVKNVAGYDFCKLLTGSLGTLGVITQLALKLKPLPDSTATITATCGDLAIAETILERFVQLNATPTAIDLLIGDAWTKEALPGHTPAAATLVVRVEGTEIETKWLADHVQYEFWQGGAIGAHLLPAADAERLHTYQTEFSDCGATASPDESPLVVKIAAPPSAVVPTIRELLDHDPACTIQSHAASGIILARFKQFASSDVSPVLVGKLRPAATARGGSLTVVSTKLEGLTPHILWGGRTDATILMERIKQQLDPHNILNPNRFVF